MKNERRFELRKIKFVEACITISIGMYNNINFKISFDLEIDIIRNIFCKRNCRSVNSLLIGFE